ncbi:MAG: single-stranded-DNA-specific exonuclease RecJ, partial [Myxococcota bacterium]|nr:single-stranded-DNA-specific exonuclease RecJ [Myxococcota bacterium]
EGLPTDPLIARLLVNRGVKDVDSARRYLHPSFEDLHDPFLLANMEQAVLRVRQAIAECQSIVIFGDDDVDGVTSTTVLYQFLQGVGADVRYFIPRRRLHGHGFNERAIAAAIGERKPQLMIATDCGLSSWHEVDWLHEQGIDTLIVDHHALPDRLPEAIIINPRLVGSAFPFIELAAVGVAFNFVLALRRHFEELGVLERTAGPNLLEYLDLVALGTVADVVPLVDENRVFVRLGLEVLRRRRRCGVAALLEKVNTDGQPISERTICYRLAPRLNAAGRVGDPNQCVSLLCADRYGVAQGLASALETYNEQRQLTEASILDEAIAMAQMAVDEGRRVLVVASDEWHQGVLGIVASRLLERFHRPSVLIAAADAESRGSARSPEGFNILDCLRMCEHLLVDFGGHSAAAGLTLKAENIPEFSQCIEDAASTLLGPRELPTPTLHIDAELHLSELSPKRLRRIEGLGPYGAGNREPAFVIRRLRLVRARVVGRNHLRLRVRNERSTFEVIGFSMGETTLQQGSLIDVVLTPRLNAKSPSSIEYQLLAVQQSA